MQISELAEVCEEAQKNMACAVSVGCPRTGADRAMSRVFSRLQGAGGRSRQALHRCCCRYQYDPNGRVRDAMTHIWAALVPEPRAALDAHFGAIADELLREMGGRMWRNREAACLGLADLLQVSICLAYGHYENGTETVTVILALTLARTLTLILILTLILTTTLHGVKRKAFRVMPQQRWGRAG